MEADTQNLLRVVSNLFKRLCSPLPTVLLVTQTLGQKNNYTRDDMSKRVLVLITHVETANPILPLCCCFSCFVLQLEYTNQKMEDALETLATQNCDLKNQLADVQVRTTSAIHVSGMVREG